LRSSKHNKKALDQMHVFNVKLCRIGISAFEYHSFVFVVSA